MPAPPPNPHLTPRRPHSHSPSHPPPRAQWLCRTPAVYVYTRAVNAPEPAYALALPASATGMQSGTMYARPAREPLYVVVVNERADVTVGYALTAALAVAGEAGHALPGLPSATPLPSASAYPPAPLNVSAPDPWYTLLDRTREDLPLLLSYPIAGGTYHTVAFTSPPAEAGTSWRATLVPAPGSRLALSAARTAPAGFQGSTYSPMETAAAYYWAPQVIAMWGPRPEASPSSTYYLRVASLAAPGDVASYNLLVEPLAGVPPPGSTQYVTSGVPAIVFHAESHHVSALVLHVTQPGWVTVTMTPLALQSPAADYFGPQYQIYNAGAGFSGNVSGGNACCNRASAPSGVHPVQPGDVTALVRVDPFAGDWAVYQVLLAFEPTGPEASQPSATPLPSALPSALPQPQPAWNLTALPPLPFTVEYDLPAYGYHNMVLAGARGLVSFRLSSLTLGSYADVYACAAPPTGAALRDVDVYASCFGSSYRAANGDTLVSVQGGAAAASTLYLRVTAGSQALRYSLSGWGAGELTPQPPSGAVLPLDEGVPITTSVLVGGYIAFRYRSPRDGPVVLSLRRLWTPRCQSVYVQLFTGPVLSPDDMLRQAAVSYDASSGCGATSTSSATTRTLPQGDPRNGGAGAEYWLIVSPDSPLYSPDSVGTGPDDGYMGTFTLEAHTEPSQAVASPTAAGTPPPTGSPLPSFILSGLQLAAPAWPQPAPYYEVTDIGSAAVALHRVVESGKFHK